MHNSPNISSMCARRIRAISLVRQVEYADQQRKSVTSQFCHVSIKGAHQEERAGVDGREELLGRGKREEGRGKRKDCLFLLYVLATSN